MSKKIDRDAVRRIVERALIAATAEVGLLGAGVELAIAAIMVAQAVVAAQAEALRVGLGGDLRVRLELALHDAKPARQAFAAWVGPAALDVEARNAGDAVLAAASAAGCYGKGDFEEALRLADNALRFAAHAIGAEAQPVAEEPPAEGAPAGELDREKVRAWMVRHAGEYSGATELAEAADLGRAS